MTGLHKVGFVLVLACSLGLACSTADSEATTAVKTFYGHLNDGNYADAMSLYDSATREQIEDPDDAGSSVFSDWAEIETKDGKFDSLEVVEETETDGETVVLFDVHYTDGTSKRAQVSLKQENGEWKLGFLQPAPEGA